MSTRHYVHNIITPGLPGDGIDDAEAAVFRTKLDTINAVSADHYSDLNDAVADAGPGGTVQLSPGVTYTQDTPIQPISNLTIQGDAFTTSEIHYTGEAGIQHLTPGTKIEGFQVNNVRLDGRDIGGIGIDARGFSRCHFDRVTVWDPGSHGIWWGGDTTEGGWTNTFSRGQVRAPFDGAAMHFEGRTSPTGAATANQIVVRDGTIYSRSSPTSYGVNIVHGESNTFFGNDGGYGVDAAAVYRFGSSLAQRNRVISARTENAKRVALIEGGRNNIFIGNVFGLYENSEFRGAEIYGGTRNMFIANWWDAKGLGPSVWEANGAGSFQTLVDDLDPTYGSLFGNAVTDPRARMHVVANPGAFAFGIRARSEARERLQVAGDGRLSWRHPSTGAEIGRIAARSDLGGVGWGDNTLMHLPRATAGLPPANAANEGVMMWVRGGSGSPSRIWACLKNASDAYEWVQVVP